MPETLPETPRSFAPTGADIGSAALRVELDSERSLRTRNKLHYRVNHWPIWIFVFFIAPGPLTFDFFDRGLDARILAWLGVVLLGTAIAGLLGRLPGCEPAPYIIRFTEDRPNPLYRRICYTTAWGEVVAFALLNIAGLLYAIVTGAMAAQADVRLRLLPDCRDDVAPGSPRPVAAGEALHRGRGS